MLDNDPTPEQIAELEQRCRTANIPFREEQPPDSERYWIIDLPNGRQTRPLEVGDLDEAFTEILGIPFEEYTYLGPYEAVVHYATGTIEALVSARLSSFSTISARLGQPRKPLDEPISPIHLDGSTIRADLSLTLSEPTPVLVALTNARRARPFALTIQGLRVSQHDDALRVLQAVSDALLFQIDLATNILPSLVRWRRDLPGPRFGRLAWDPVQLQFPSTEFDDAPMSLYRYACSASGMPLLQFLAYYQAIEYYFPVHSEADARRRVRAVLKDPLFRTERDSDLARILVLARGRGTGFGDERSQLKATLLECVDSASLRAFITERPEREAALAAKVKGLTDVKIPLANPAADIRDEVAERVYDIRCRIVHTKSSRPGSETEVLLPFSDGVSAMGHDLALVRYLAQRVLVASATRLAL